MLSATRCMPPDKSVFQFFSFRLLALGFGEVVPPAKLLQKDVVELGIAGGDFTAHGTGTVFGQQVHAFVLDAVARAEGAAAVHDRFGRVVQVWRAGMLDLAIAPAGPRQPEVVARQVVARFLVLAAVRAQRLDVEYVHVAHMRLEAFGRLTGVADGPSAAVDFAQRVLHLGLVHTALALDQFDVLLAVLLSDELVGESELLRQLVHDHVVGARLEQGLDHAFAPLQRAVRRGNASRALELRRRRQKVSAILSHH